MTLKRKGDSNLNSLNTLKQTFLESDYLGAIPCTMFPCDALGIQSIPPRILSKRFFEFSGFRVFHWELYEEEAGALSLGQ